MLFDLIFYVPPTIYHYCRDGSSWTSTKLRLMCLAHPPTYHYLPIYQYLPVHQPTHLPTLLIPTHGHPPTYHYIHTYLLTYMHTHLPTYLHTHQPTHLPTLPLPTYQPRKNILPSSTNLPYFTISLPDYPPPTYRTI